MSTQKQKKSPARQGTRRAHQVLNPSLLTRCSHCQQPVLPHRVCPHCGYYKGKEVFNPLKKRGTKNAK